MTTLLPTNKIGVVILAAGAGKRMQSDLPKVMHRLEAGEPLIERVVRTVEKAGLPKPVIIVSAKHPLVQDHLGSARAIYVVQDQPLGTAHAVSKAEPILKDTVDKVLILYGDMPFLNFKSLKRLVENKNNNTLTFLTAQIPDSVWPAEQFAEHGKIVRHSAGKVEAIVEKKDANEEQVKIKEVNTGIMCVKSNWLWKNLRSIEKNNIKGEYYLTDLIKIAADQGEKIGTYEIPWSQALGINRKEHLQDAQRLGAQHWD